LGGIKHNISGNIHCLDALSHKVACSRKLVSSFFPKMSPFTSVGCLVFPYQEGCEY